MPTIAKLKLVFFANIQIDSYQMVLFWPYLLVVISIVNCTALSQSTRYYAVQLRPAIQNPLDADLGRPLLVPGRPEYQGLNDHGDLVTTGWNGGKSSEGTYSYRRPFYYNYQLDQASNLGDLTGDFGDPTQPDRNEISEALAINNLGWVAGSSPDAEGILRPFIWVDHNGNGIRDLAPIDEMIGLELNPQATRGECVDITDSGYALISGDTGWYRARFEIQNYQLVEVCSRMLVTTSGVSRISINEVGSICYSLQGTNASGRVWRDLNENQFVDPNEVLTIPSVSATELDNTAYSINNHGQVCGTMDNDLGSVLGYVWTDVDHDHVCDWDDTDGDGIFDWNETSDEFDRFSVAQGPLNFVFGNSFAHNLNDAAQVVGGYAISSSRVAFVWDKKAGASNLNDITIQNFDGILTQCLAINNAGQIALYNKYNPGTGTIEALTLLDPIRADMDQNGLADLADLGILAGFWFQTNCEGRPGCNGADLNRDGIVDVKDLLIWLNQWLEIRV